MLRIINDRYQIVEILSEEFNSTECLVRDLHNWGMLKVMRIFDADILSASFLKYFESSFVDIKNHKHPNIVNLYEFSPVRSTQGVKLGNDQFFYTCEYIAERQISYLDIEKAQINDVIAQICKIIRYLHFRGVVYRFLNFDNLRIYMRSDNTVYVKLANLADVSVFEHVYPDSYEFTSDFVAPEMNWEEKIGFSVDIYSLGMMLYYIYYRKDYNVESVAHIRSTNPLNSFILRCISQIPEDRYQSIDEFIGEVEKLLWINVTKDDYIFYDRIHDSTKLVGRSGIVSGVMDVIEAKHQRSTNINSVYIVGEYGAGKTRVLREISRICGFRKHTFVRIDIDKNVKSHDCMSEVIRSILASDNNIVNLVSKYWRELKVIVPEFFMSYQWGESALDFEKDSLRILNRAIKFVQEYCYNKCFIILLDGAEYLHGYDREFFAQLLRISQPLNLLMIFGVPALDGFEGSGYQVFELEDLNKEQIREMLSQFLGTQDLPEEYVDQVIKETNGRASQVRRVIQAYYFSKVVFFDREKYQWIFSRTESDYDIGFYSDYMRTRANIAEGIGRQELEKLKKMSILTAPVSCTVLFDLLGIDEAGLSKLLEKRLLAKNADDKYSINDRDLKNVLYKNLSGEEFREYSESMANALLRAGCTDSSLVQHLRDAGDYSQASRYALVISEEYFKSQNINGCINMLRTAEEMYAALGERHRADEVALHLAGILYNAARLGDVLSLLDKRSFSDQRHAMLSGIILGRTYLMLGRNDESLSYITGAFNIAVELGEQEAELKCYHLLYDYYFDMLDPANAAEVLNTALELADREEYFAYRYMIEVKSGAYGGGHAEDLMQSKFEAACRYFEEKEDVLFLCEMHDLEAQRRYYGGGEFANVIKMFDVSEDIAIKQNYTLHTMIYQYLFANICWHYSMYAQAANRLDKAMAYAKESGALNIGTMALAKYISTKIELCEYRQANIHISKLEYETKFVNGHKNATTDLQFYKLKYLLLMNNLVEARRLRYELDVDSITDKRNSFRVRVMDIKLTYLSELQRGRFELGEEIIVAMHDLLRLVDSSVNAKLYRELALEITMNLIMNGDISNANLFLKLDDRASSYYKSERIDITRMLIDVYMDDKNGSGLESIAGVVRKESLELLWRLHYLRGKIFLGGNDYFEALRAYLRALEVLKDLTDHVSFVHQKQYIFGDPFKILLKVRINDIIKHIGEIERVRCNLEPKKIVDVQDYFDLSNFALMMEDQEVAFKLNAEAVSPQEISYMSKYTISDTENLRQVLKHLSDIVFAKRGYIFALNENNEFDDVVSLHEGGDHSDFLRYIYGSESERSIVVNKFNNATQTYLLRSGQCGLIHIPVFELAGDRRREKWDEVLHRKKKIIAHLFFDTDDVINRFEFKFLSYLESYSTLIAVFLESAKLKLSSTVDKLTQVNIRKYFEHVFTITLIEARGSDEELSVVILDIDNFKGVNDTYGHKKGDTVLASVGQILLSSVRSTDFVARYGGEEFVVLLPNTNGEQAYVVSEKIRRNVEAARLLGDDRPLTVSLGIASFPDDGLNEAELIENADKALYYSKGQGKNQTTRWTRFINTQAKRFDKMTGIISGRVEDDIRRVQAILRCVLAMGVKDKNAVREDVFRTILDIVGGTKAEFYLLDENKRVVEAVGYETAVGICEISEYDEINIAKYGNSNSSDYFIDWGRPIKADNAPTDWESVIVNSFKTDEVNGILLFKAPISAYEYGFADFNYVASIRKVLERAIF